MPDFDIPQVYDFCLVLKQKLNIKRIESVLFSHYTVSVERKRIDTLPETTMIQEVKALLNEMTNASLIRLNIEADDWQDAVRKAAAPLVENNKIKPGYVDEIINGVLELGPYIVITKHVALPHARPEAGALESAIGIATLKHPIKFGNKDNDPVKYMFTLSATDNIKHLNALAEMAGLFEEKEFFDMLDRANDPMEVMNYLNK